MTFVAHAIDPARTLAFGLYEPMVAAGRDGTLYVAAHTEGVYATRAPTWASHDQGASWRPMPGPTGVASGDAGVDSRTSVLAGTGVEGIVVTDERSHAWLWDNGAQTGSLYEWCDRGTVLCRYVPQAYDAAANAAGCRPFVILDRPWHAAASGRVLLENNGNGILQLGMFDASSGEVNWNMCVSEGIPPGVPAMRAGDGVFAVPQVTLDWSLRLVHGTDVMHPTITEDVARPILTGMPCGGANFGFSGVSADGTFMTAVASKPTEFTVVATRDFVSFSRTSYETTDKLAYLWLAANPNGRGALVSWVTAHDDCAAHRPSDGLYDFHAAHVVDDDGGIRVEDASLVAGRQPNAYGDYMGSTVLPDGRAAVVAYADPDAVFAYPTYAQLSHPQTAPLTVYVQDGGPTMHPRAGAARPASEVVGR